MKMSHASSLSLSLSPSVSRILSISSAISPSLCLHINPEKPSVPDITIDANYKGVRKRKWVSKIILPNSRERIWLGSYNTPDIPGLTSLPPSEIQTAAARFVNSQPAPPFNCTTTEDNSSSSSSSMIPLRPLSLTRPSKRIGSTTDANPPASGDWLHPPLHSTATSSGVALDPSLLPPAIGSTLLPPATASGPPLHPPLHSTATSRILFDYQDCSVFFKSLEHNLYLSLEHPRAKKGMLQLMRNALHEKNVAAEVYVGMRYWHPFTGEAIEQFKTSEAMVDHVKTDANGGPQTSNSPLKKLEKDGSTTRG
ncbi:hypothetical protein L2E82_19006 [Cichorium intybus]|uniref:Uncharacterized protein n=1 Tax=Cichorium intybus TaxID=13427 RepID=A0ACB9FB92_CICIN|nr:hypothetical protein L2E82_19006 [Cichorium intybus]